MIAVEFELIYGVSYFLSLLPLLS